MSTIDDTAEGIVLASQEYAETVWFARLTAAFYKTLVEDGIGRLTAKELTREWMMSQHCADGGDE